jgi:hypothetical protein
MSAPALMVKKIFAVASVVGLAGLMATSGLAGCSSTKSDAASDAGNDSATQADEGEAPAAVACPSLEPIDATKLAWRAPSVLSGSCTDKELEDFVGFVDAHAAAKYVDWKNAVANGACNSCIFGKETDATWKPLLEDAKGQLVALNVGGCIAIASGSDACGQSYQNWFDCRFEACATCPNGDSAALQKCLSAASKSACKKAHDDVTTVCTARAINDAETACEGGKFVFEGPIRAQCIGMKEGGE